MVLQKAAVVSPGLGDALCGLGKGVAGAGQDGEGLWLGGQRQ